MGKLTLVRCEPQEIIDDVEEQQYRSLVQDPFGGMLIVPSGAAKRQAVDRMLKREIVLLGDPVCTLEELANNIFEDCCVSEISIGVEEAELILKSVMDENRSSLIEFEPLWAGIGPTVSELRALFDTWRQFMVPPSVISSPGGDTVNDHILSIFEKYLDRTARSKLYDSVGVMQCAIRWLKENRVSLKKVWMVGLNELNPLQRDLVKAVRSSAREMEFIVRNDGGKTFSEDLSWLEADETSVKECPKAEELTRFRNGTEIRAIVFADPLGEARAVAGKVRRLISSGTSPSEICVMLPMREKSAPLFREMLEESGVWCNLDVPIPLNQSPIVHVMLDLLEAVSEDMPREHVVRLLSSPYIRFRYGQEQKERLSGGMVSSYGEQAGVIGGGAPWKEKLDLLRKSIEDDASSPEVPAEKAKQLSDKAMRVASVADGLIELFTVLGQIKGTMTVEQRVIRLKPVLKRLETDRHLAHEDERIYNKEARSLAAFFGVLDTLISSETFNPVGKETLGSFVARVKVMCSHSKHYVEPSYDNAVLVTGLRAAALTRHEHVFIVGMVEGDLPFLGAGNPFIDDADVGRMGLLSKWDILRQERLFFLSALETAGKGVSLSGYRSNDGGKVVSSSFFDDVTRILSPPSFAEEVNHASKICEQKALGAAIAGKLPLEGITEAINLTPDELLRRINMEAFHRVGGYDSPFDGVLDDERIVQELGRMLGPDKVFSPTQLEVYSTCPFRFYLNSVLHIEPRPELEREIAGKDQGTFVHEVAYRLYSQLRSGGMTMTADNLDAVEKLAKAIAQVELAEMKFTGPAWEAFQARMVGSVHRKGLLRAFLEYEVANPSPFSPSYFELSFGRRKPESCDPASTEEPVRIDLGAGSDMLLAGRIDRVDVDRDGRFLVMDYKTGALPSVSDVKEGRSLQVQLYMQAVKNMLDGRQGVGGIFYLVKNEAEIEYSTVVVDKANVGPLRPIIRGKHCLDVPIEELVRNTNAFLSAMLTNMRKGVFHPATTEKGCKSFCDYKQVCRFDRLRLMDMEGE